MSNIFTVFKEHKDFYRNVPWTVLSSDFREGSSVAPHYADTVELLLMDGAEGDVRIGGRFYKLSGRQVFFIPPESVHSMNYLKCGGKMKNVKLSPEGFSEFLNIGAMLEAEGVSFDSISTAPPCYDDILPHVSALSAAEDIYSALIAVIGIFSVLRRYGELNGGIETKGKNAFSNTELKKIIGWTNEHYNKRVLVEDAARAVGYSKFYFCEKFRSSTGITYNNYLNGVRISKACALLKGGASIAAAAEGCGFCDISYFIHTFKKIKGLTPKQYINQSEYKSPSQ